jgi:CTP:phosphocholine cytidylyltransferase-like protein
MDQSGSFYNQQESLPSSLVCGLDNYFENNIKPYEQHHTAPTTHYGKNSSEFRVNFKLTRFAGESLPFRVNSS